MDATATTTLSYSQDAYVLTVALQSRPVEVLINTMPRGPAGPAGPIGPAGAEVIPITSADYLALTPEQQLDESKIYAIIN